jgi:hypothetical protein
LKQGPAEIEAGEDDLEGRTTLAMVIGDAPTPGACCRACARHHLLCSRWHPMSRPRRPHYATPVSDAAHAPALTSCHARLDAVPTPLPVLRDTKPPGIIRRVPRRRSSLSLSLSLSLLLPNLSLPCLFLPFSSHAHARQHAPKGAGPSPRFLGLQAPATRSNATPCTPRAPRWMPYQSGARRRRLSVFFGVWTPGRCFLPLPLPHSCHPSLHAPIRHSHVRKQVLPCSPTLSLSCTTLRT